ALAQAYRQHVARDAEVLHRARQRKAVGRDHAHVGFDVDEAPLVEVLRVDHGAEDVGEHLEFTRATDVVAVARRAIADDAVAVGSVTHLPGLERLDHGVLGRHAADPSVALDALGRLARKGARFYATAS